MLPRLAWKYITHCSRGLGTWPRACSSSDRLRMRSASKAARRPVGARRKDILTQFLIEAVTVTALGGAIGVGTGFGLAYIISALIGFPLLVSVASAVLGVGVSSVVGIVSGLWPAWRAAKLDPIEALRAE